MKKAFQRIISVTFVLATVLNAMIGTMASAAEDININVSPMRESMVINPGDTYKSSFKVSNPGFSENDLYYHVELKPFYVNENYQPVFDDKENVDKQMMVDWITITANEQGVVAPNEAITVEYEIKVPENAPAGGQYACLSATTDVAPGTAEGINISEGIAINHVVLAEITGETVAAGEIKSAGIQTFMLNGKVKAYSTVKNTGNVHGLATYAMTVKPLFSNEIVYSNVDNPEDHFVLPEREMYNESYWEETPMMGVFDVTYKVEFQGDVSEVTGIVVICPWWVLFIVIAVMVLLVMRLISLSKLRKAIKVVEKTDENQVKNA